MRQGGMLTTDVVVSRLESIVMFKDASGNKT